MEGIAELKEKAIAYYKMQSKMNSEKRMQTMLKKGTITQGEFDLYLLGKLLTFSS